MDTNFGEKKSYRVKSWNQISDKLKNEFHDGYHNWTVLI